MLYQLSYASSYHRKLLRSSEERAGTRPLRTYHGTEVKVSIPATAEQTRKKQGIGIKEQGMKSPWQVVIVVVTNASNLENFYRIDDLCTPLFGTDVAGVS